MNNWVYVIIYLYYHKYMYDLVDLKQTFHHYAKMLSIISVTLNLFIISNLFISNLKGQDDLVNCLIIKKLHFLNNCIYIDLSSNPNWMHMMRFEYLLIKVYLVLLLLLFDHFNVMALRIQVENYAIIMIIYSFIEIFVYDKTVYEWLNSSFYHLKVVLMEFIIFFIPSTFVIKVYIN